MATEKPVLTGQILDDASHLSLAELCQACALHAELILEMVDEGVLEPLDRSAAQWRFRSINLRRAQTAVRLQRDLGVNLAGAALALELRDEIERLRMRLRLLEQRL